jgi:drug/metabolite transporter (DMT)-like permease
VIIAFDAAQGNKRRLFSKRGIDLTRVEIIGGILCGAVLALASFFQQQGINEGADAGKSAFITALYVVLVPIYGIFLRKKAPVNVWISMPFAVVGFYLLCITDSFTIEAADVFVIICALIFPVHILVIDRFSPVCDGVRMSCVQFFSAAVINAVLALIFESPIPFPAIGDAILSVLYLGICSSGIAYTLQIIGQRGTDPSAASILLSLESVFGVLGAAVLLGEQMSLREYIGCAVVFAAVIISQLDLGALLGRKKKDALGESAEADTNSEAR